MVLRDLPGEKPIIALVDGGVGLEEAICDALQAEGLTHRLQAVILDLIHVTEYIWVAANATLGESSPSRSAWVEKQLLLILDSRVREVVIALKWAREKPKTTKSTKKALDKVIKYFENHEHKMDYKAYLEKGFPISTGLVEGACGHLVKDRMERSGMQWSKQGAQATLDARAVKRNGDWDPFIHNLERKNQDRYYRNTA